MPRLTQAPAALRIQVHRFLIRLHGLLDRRAPSPPVPARAGTRIPPRARCWREFTGRLAGNDLTPLGSAVSKSNRIWPLIGSIFWPATCTAIRRPSGRNLELGKRVFHAGDLSLQGSHGQADFLRGDVIFAEFKQRSQADQILERETRGIAHQSLPLPSPELLFGDTQHPADVLARILLLGHVLLQAEFYHGAAARLMARVRYDPGMPGCSSRPSRYSRSRRTGLRGMANLR